MNENGKSKKLFWVGCLLLLIGGFVIGIVFEKLSQSVHPNTTPTNTSTIHPCPPVVCPKVECPEECIYNDVKGYKFIKWEKNGAWCVGVKPYDSPDIKWYRCGKEK